MAQIHFNSERFRLAFSIETAFGSAIGSLARASEVAPREGLSLGFTASGQGVASVSPAAGEFTFGASSVLPKLRYVGGMLYTFEPAVASYDGHRPWVAKKLTGPFLGSINGLGVSAAGSQGSFMELISLIGKAQAVEATGSATVNGQSTASFSASLSFASLITGKNATRKLALLRAAGFTTAALELFVTPGGVPARVKLVLSSPKLSEAVTVDALAFEVPVVVKMPPPRKTISKARLRRIQRRHRVCLRLPASHHKSRRICTTPAEQGGSPLGSGTPELGGSTTSSESGLFG